MRAARRAPQRFDARAHERELAAILDAVAARPDLDAQALDRLVRRHPRAGRGLFSKSEILAGYRSLGGASRFRIDEERLLVRMRLRPVRSLSGVTPVTLLTRPHPCPGRCVFCPSDVRMPKSYLSQEPGAQRAEDNGFDPYLQTWNRLAAYRQIGHPVSKLELIVLGGTWSAHPGPYQRWFAARCFEALNDFGAGVDGRQGAARRSGPPLGAGEPIDGRRPGGGYNAAVARALAARRGAGGRAAGEAAGWSRLEAAQRDNERSAARCVGLSFETRPDLVSLEEALRLRRLGATKVQLGIQSLSDDVLARNRRGHDADATRAAIALLRRLGFKIQGHWMLNLLGSTPERDVADFARLFDDPALRPDELKLYPCALVESAELMAHFERGEWRPYTEEDLLGVVTECLARVPRYCRVTRVIRDFSAADIVAGSRTANLREVAERRLRAEGRPCRDVRSREIGARRVDPAALRPSELRHASADGEERFLELATPDDRLVAFLRLGLPGSPAPVAELAGRALVREVHVYGASLEVGRPGGRGAQHRGLGRRLLARAAETARERGFTGLAVISAVGTRAYYRGLGFRDGALYQHLEVGQAIA